MNQPSLRVVAIAHAKPGQEETLAAAFRACVPPSRAEDGCHEYTAYRDNARPNRFVVVETWTSKAHLDAHARTAHFRDLAEVVGRTTESGVEIMLLTEL